MMTLEDANFNHNSILYMKQAPPQLLYPPPVPNNGNSTTGSGGGGRLDAGMVAGEWVGLVFTCLGAIGLGLGRDRQGSRIT
jgi:hypothetical protein